MKVKLLKPWPGLGRSDDIIDVSDAQARNFLLPKKIAILATAGVVKSQQQHLEKNKQRQAEHDQALTTLLKQLEQSGLQLHGKANEQGKLFAAVKTSDIQRALEQQYKLSLSSFRCKPDHLKTLGSHDVRVTIDHVHQASIIVEITNGS